MDEKVDIDEKVDDEVDEKKEDEDPPETETGKNQLVKEQRIEVGMNDNFPRLRPQLEFNGVGLITY